MAKPIILAMLLFWLCVWSIWTAQLIMKYNKKAVTVGTLAMAEAGLSLRDTALYTSVSNVYAREGVINQLVNAC